ncbi:cytidylyltransferase domain-containing protein [Albibacterium sp.]|uniref:cytidylyltransferase domain-containing protein n=1 Tax=Albibacterium sp. TaxID=2952885 RepID=UPI002B9D509F|nr:N-acetylneuraminate synthase family protein [Albibacterium sp.]HUH18903.1 N-acetylneuraminate synthase family protein [Albibacterium sp.]
MEKPYYIIELANSHGGDIDYINELIESFDDLKDGFGIKFQCFHPDLIALKDFRAYELYKELHFNSQVWKTLILKASKTKDIWLDIFDTYGVNIYMENIDIIYGVKFQASVLYNNEIIDALSKIGLTNKKLILNIAAQSIEDIDHIILSIKNKLKPETIFLEFGFQAYPTSLEDSGLSKIHKLKESFPYELVFADHTDGTTENAIWLPVVAYMMGARIIEKHVMLDTRETKYDHFSSLTPAGFRSLVKKVNTYAELNEKPFIIKPEIEYFEKTLMKPILKRDLKKGKIPSLQNDFIYRRSNQDGLNVKEINELITSQYILSKDVEAGKTLLKEDFKKAKIGIVVVCRMKSTRLPKKALLKIGNLTSVEYCIKNVLKLENVDKVVLATSVLPDDEILKDYTYSNDVGFYQGDPEDVMQRVLDVAKIYDFDLVCRVTADMPLISNEIFNCSLKSHFKSSADYTAIKGAPIGFGVNIMNVEALERAKEYFPDAKYSEYLVYYFINNPTYFCLNTLTLPESLQRDYRLTLDYESDLKFFNVLDERIDFESLGRDYTQQLYDFLDNNEQIVNMNKNEAVMYKTDKELINRIIKYTTLPVKKEI